MNNRQMLRILPVETSSERFTDAVRLLPLYSPSAIPVTAVGRETVSVSSPGANGPVVMACGVNAACPLWYSRRNDLNRRRLPAAMAVLFLVLLTSMYPTRLFAQPVEPASQAGVGVLRLSPQSTPVDRPAGSISAAGSNHTVSALVIDTDPGVDDAAAIAALLSLPDPPEIRGIVTVFGNSNPRDGANTVLNLLALAGRTDIQVVIGENKCPYKAKKRECPSVGAGLHGPDGLWGQSTANPQPGLDALATKAKDFYCKPPHGTWAGTTLLTLGPLTNVAEAVKKCPEIMETFDAVTILGGARAGGNFTPVAEYNFWQNADAARDVLSPEGNKAGKYAALSPAVVPLEAFSQLTYDPALLLPELAANGNDVIRFVLPALQIYTFVLDANGLSPALPDVAALALALDRSLGVSQSALLKVTGDDTGQARGQSVVGLGFTERLTMIADERELAQIAVTNDLGLIGEILAREPDNVHFVMDIDEDTILAGFLAAVTAETAAGVGGAGARASDPASSVSSPDGETENAVYLPLIR